MSRTKVYCLIKEEMTDGYKQTDGRLAGKQSNRLIQWDIK